MPDDRSHDDPHDDQSYDGQVRRLLAESRHTDPIPTDIAERMDGVLADLRAEIPVRPPVADLAAARRRRRARALLLAAAAVVVVGVSVGQLGGGDMSADNATSGSAPADREPRSESAGDSANELQSDERETPGDSANDSTDGGGGAFSNTPGIQSGRTARVSSDDFAAAALRLRSRADQLQRFALTDGASFEKDPTCPPSGWGRGEGVRIRYDGSPAVLVYRAPSGDTQVVDLFLCGRDEPSRSITLPAP